jgi:archaellum biogenesis ATPase FlaH
MKSIGGANLIAITGPFGSGKSLLLLEFCLAMAEHYQKPLVINFSVQKKEIYKYCKHKNYKWLCEQMEAKEGNEDPIKFIDLFVTDAVKNDSLDLLFKDGDKSRRNCIVCVDELGVFLNARNWQKVSTNFTKYLCQVRRMRVHVIVAFQFLEQVDKQFRLLVQHWITCKGISIYDRQLNGPRLIARFAYHYAPAKFNKLESSTTTKAAFVRPWLWAKRVDYHVLPLGWFIAEFKNANKKRPQDKFKPYHDEGFLFRCFDSFEVLEAEDKNSDKSKKEIAQTDTNKNNKDNNTSKINTNNAASNDTSDTNSSATDNKNAEAVTIDQFAVLAEGLDIPDPNDNN